MNKQKPPFAVRLHGRAFWVSGDGLVPVIAGGDGDDDPTVDIPTIDDLTEERATVTQELDDLVETARSEERDLTDAERATYDTLSDRFDTLSDQIDEVTAHEGDVRRFTEHERRRRYAIPNVNVVTDDPVSANRSLDELLWATSEDVEAGSFDKTGNFRRNPYGARNSIEQVTVRSDSGFQVAPRISEFRPEHRNAIRSFQRTVSDMVLFGLMVDRSARSSIDGFQVARGHEMMSGRWQRALRAMDVDTSNEGTEWVPTGIGADLHEKVRASGKIAPLFSRINLPTNPWKWPVEGADATAYRVGEPTGDTESSMTASTPGTVAPTFDAEIFGARALFSKSLEADSALAILPYVRRKLVQAFVDAEEKAVLDGDSDGTHQDGDVGASTTDARTAWDGLRKRALANAKVDTNGALSAAKLHEIRSLMGKWGLNPADLAFIIGVSSFYDVVDDTEVHTVDKLGPQATILNGQLGSVYGIPLIVSEHIREDLNASGVQDGITETKAVALCVNRNEWAFGQRMALDVEVDDSIYRESYQRVMVGFQREDFQNIGDASTNDDTAVGYNVTP